MTQTDAYRELFRLSTKIPDRRGDQGKLHVLAEVMVIIVIGLLANCQNAEDIAAFARSNLAWLRTFLTMKHGAPSHDTILNITALVDPALVEQTVRAWTEALREPGALTTDGGHVAFDGQTLRGSANRRLHLSGVHMISAYLTGLGVTLGSLRVDEKTNEIKAIPDLIKSLQLRGATVTIDAMGCQREIAKELRGAGANYVLQVKENQETLLGNIVETAAEIARRRRPGEAPAGVDRYREVDKGHGRLETRVCVLSRDLSRIERKSDWADLSAIAIMLRETEHLVSGKKTQETSYYIVSSATATAKETAQIIRNHWEIECGLHWSLDVVWGSDAHQVRDRRAAENFGRLRRFAAGLIKRSTGARMSGRQLRNQCGWVPATTLQILAGEVIDRPTTRRVLDPKRFKAKPSA